MLAEGATLGSADPREISQVPEPPSDETLESPTPGTEGASGRIGNSSSGRIA